MESASASCLWVRFLDFLDSAMNLPILIWSINFDLLPAPIVDNEYLNKHTRSVELPIFEEYLRSIDLNFCLTLL